MPFARAIVRFLAVPFLRTHSIAAGSLKTAQALVSTFPSFPVHMFAGDDATLHMKFWSAEQYRIALRWSWEQCQGNRRVGLIDAR